MSKKSENTAFSCLRCGLEVVPLSNGSYRNHCAECLYSKHVDVVPGDRASSLVMWGRNGANRNEV